MKKLFLVSAWNLGRETTLAVVRHEDVAVAITEILLGRGSVVAPIPHGSDDKERPAYFVKELEVLESVQEFVDPMVYSEKEKFRAAAAERARALEVLATIPEDALRFLKFAPAKVDIMRLDKDLLVDGEVLSVERRVVSMLQAHGIWEDGAETEPLEFLATQLGHLAALRANLGPKDAS